MLTTQARLAKRNHDPVRLVGDLYFIEDFRKSYNGLNPPVAIIRKVFNQKYSKAISVDVEYLEKLTESELKAFHEKTKEEK